MRGKYKCSQFSLYLDLRLQMGWHAGNTLSQTVYTLLYVHSLQDINPDLVSPQYFYINDSMHPMELITIVLRPAIFALLKSCDLVWRELSRKGVYDVSDSLYPGRQCNR